MSRINKARWFTAALLCVLGLLMTVAGIREYRLQRALLADARPIEVTILQSEITEHHYTAPGGEDEDDDKPDYRPDVTFAYIVDNHYYTSQLLYPRRAITTYPKRETARQQIERFKPGATTQASIPRRGPTWRSLTTTPVSARSCSS